MTKKKLFEQCIEEWGTEANIKQLLEEMGELIVAVCHYPRGKSTKEDIKEEMADVQLMLDICKGIYGIDKKEFREEYNKKLKSVKERLKDLKNV